MNQPTILILDDDCAFARSAGQLAYEEGFRVQLVRDLREARSFLGRNRADLMLLDLNLPDGTGLDLLDDIDLAHHGQIAVVTGNPTIETAMRAVASPVMEYLIKPLCPKQLQELLHRNAQRHWTSRSDTASSAVDELAGNSAPMRSLVETILRISASDASVLLSGESGTGKELVARAIHDASGRSGPFIAINCGAVPTELLASQLFGHERGSFTGARSRYIGVFEQAAHGTLFLDEITEMPLHLQVYLLRAIETGSVTRVGGTEPIPTPVRIVAATNADPVSATANGTFREDLYYRLADLPLTLPPLRDRGDDIVLLANLFIRRLNTHYGQHKRLAPGADLELLRHAWPGNVRELRSAVQRAYLLQRSDLLQVSPARFCPVDEIDRESSIVFSVGTTLAEMERRAVMATLAYFGNDKAAAARALGVSVRTIYNHLSRIADESVGASETSRDIIAAA